MWSKPSVKDIYVCPRAMGSPGHLFFADVVWTRKRWFFFGPPITTKRMVVRGYTCAMEAFDRQTGRPVDWEIKNLVQGAAQAQIWRREEGELYEDLRKEVPDE